MAVAARFYVSEITKHAYNPGASRVALQPVTRGAENKTWAAATPSGKIDLGIDNEAAAKWFADRLGKEVAITFEDRPALCELCRGEITFTGRDAGFDVMSWHKEQLPDLTVGAVVHARCFSEAADS